MTNAGFPDDARILYEAAKLAQFERCDALWWRWNDTRTALDVYVLCNDVFWWGTGDAEKITLTNLPRLQRAVYDVTTVTEDPYYNIDDAFLLFVARVRGMRPQGAFYDHINVLDFDDSGQAEARTARLRALFDAAGPPREIDLFNPKDQNGVYRYQPQEAS